MIAALYIDPRGPYPKMADVDCWDESRDARLYAGPHPVVAHPPCQLWGSMAAVNWARWGGEHNRPGNDGGCFEAAISAVRQWGGVLEHPAFTRAWQRYGLTRPPLSGWVETATGEWVCEVWQSAYGHRCDKRTWLFYVGKAAPEQANWAHVRGTHQIGGWNRPSSRPSVRGRAASESPQLFAEYLVRLAKSA